MNEYEKKQRREAEQKQQEREKLQDQQMRTLAEDRETLRRAAQPDAQPFKYSSKKNLARNYRDYALARELNAERPAPGVFQKAADHLALRAEMLTGMDRSLPLGDEPLPAGEAPLDALDCVKALCRCSLLEKDVTADELVDLTEHLTAGKYLVDKKDDPDAALHGQMRAQGLDALREVYCRVLDGLAEKYGAGLTRLSACDYLRRLPQIEYDFAPLADMRRFFAHYRPGTDSPEDERLRAQLNYFSESYAVLRERADALTSMRADVVTDKGSLTKDAEKGWAKRLTTLRSDAAKGKLLTRRAEKQPLAGFFAEAEERKKRAAEVLLNEGITLGDTEITAGDEQAAVEKIQNRLTPYVSYRQARDLLDSPNATEDDKRMARRAVARYEKSRDRLTDEQATELSHRMDAMKGGFTTTPGLVGVTQENTLEVIAQQRENEEKICRFLSEASDEELLKNSGAALALARLVKAQMLQLEFSYLGDWTSSVRLYEKDRSALTDDMKKKLITAEVYQQRRGVVEAYTALRGLDARSAPLYNRAEKIVFSRLRGIRESGCTQSFRLTDRSEPALEHERLLKTEQAPVLKKTEESRTPAELAMEMPLSELSFAEARHLNVPADIFDAQSDSGSLTSLSAMKHVLAAMKLVDEMRRSQPDYYRLGQSYSDYANCELLAGLLPSFEETYLLMLRKNMLAARGGEAQADIEKDFDAALSRYKAASQRLSEQLAGGDGRGEKLLAKNLTETEEKAKALHADKKLADDGVSPELVEKAERSGALIFVDTAQRQTQLKDLKTLAPLLGRAEGVPFDEAAQASAVSLLGRFSRSYVRCMDALKKGASPYGDAAFVDNAPQLEACVLMAGAIRRLVGEDERQKLAQTLKDTPFTELTAFELEHFDERADELARLSRYAAGLALRQAAANGARRCSYTADGEPATAKNVKEIELAARLLRQSGLASVTKLRVGEQTAQNADQIMMTRVRESVGRELVASARKGKWQSIRYALEWVGNRLGKPLQFLSWVLHEKRTDRHGEVCYDESRALYDQRLAHTEAAKTSVLPSWQRGSAAVAPPLELDKYYGSKLKKDLRARLDADGAAAPSDDPLAGTYNGALEALRLYCGVVGVVNTDTTEMEMAFLDRFKKSAKHYREYYENSGDASVQKRLALLTGLENALGGALEGTLGKSLSKKELALIDSSTTAYVEDTCYLPNMKESNIRDIPLFLHEPTINDVRQSSIGDCWLVSAVGTLVKTNPDYIRGMFHDLGDGNVLVRLYAADDAQGRPLGFKGNITEPGVRFHPAYFKLRKQYETGWGNAADCTWVQLLEKAYALGGFNTRNAVEVREDRLYNVADELTMGDINAALAHLTGRVPDSVYRDVGFKEDNFLAEQMLSGLLAGVEKGAADYLTLILQDAQRGVPYMKEKEKRRNGLGTILELLDAYGPNAVSKMQDGHATQIPGEQQRAAAQLKEQVRTNFEKMQRGERLDFGDEQKNREQDVQTDERLSDRRTRAHLCTFFGEAREDTTVEYSDKETYFYQQCRQVFEKGGAVSVAIPHCVSLIDAKAFNGRLFLLMRDPFNAYNTVYDEKNGETTSREEAFWTMIGKREENRHIPAAPGDYLTAGFGGSSWMELKDIFAKLTDSRSLVPEQLKNPAAD